MTSLVSKSTLLWILFLIFTPLAGAQTPANAGKNPPQTTFSRKTIEGKEYYLYRVEEDDSLDSIGSRFNVTTDIIIQYNPELKQAPPAKGHLLLIPVRYNTAQIANASKTFEHIVSSGETLYSLSRMYGVSINSIISLNPEAEEVIRTGDTLHIPQNAIEGNPIQSQDTYVYHTVAAGETLYSLSIRYHTSVNGILNDNPGITPQTLAIGQVIRISSDNIDLSERQPDNDQVFYYQVKSRKETIESVAEEFGVTVEEILQVNGGKNLVEKGNRVAIPKKAGEGDIPSLHRREKAPGDPYNIALLLPFMNDKPLSDRSTLYTEFYEGFLLAADSMKRAGMTINLYALDTRGDNDYVKTQLDTLADKNIDLIIGPVEDNSIATVARFARQNDINLINPFVVKNDEAERNNKVFQCYIQHENLYAQSREKILDEINGRQIVFVMDDSGKENDKNGHLDLIKKSLLQRAYDFVEISLGQDPYMQSFNEMVPNASDILFFTNASTRSGVGKVLAPLMKLREENPSLKISLYGYPEWQLYTKEFIDQFHRLNTTYFTRFYVLPTDSAAMEVQDKFLYWFHKDMLPASPQHVLLGYDTGLFFLTALQQFGRNFDQQIESLVYPGIQMGFHFQRINNWSGFVNNTIYFVRFNPSFEITREIITEEPLIE
ncbi:MAG: LysM peptidoglycan-binding domain-containing protein [Porphyromonadaceae bacterium]|nr:LysM peptidoglycan-binding domain-containing protein [Porphyromonadaceae bacterium]